MTSLQVDIVAFVDESFPGFVRCAFFDATGKRHTFIEKIPVVTTQPSGTIRPTRNRASYRVKALRNCRMKLIAVWLATPSVLGTRWTLRVTPQTSSCLNRNLSMASLGVKILRVDADNYPDARELHLVGTYSPVANAGGGYVWDDVLEYRVWCHPERGSPDLEDGNDYYYPFATYAEALGFSQRTEGAEAPLALIRQVEYIAEPNPGEYRHVKEERIAEWPVEFLRRPRRTPNTIPDFLSPNAPANRLDIIRGLANPTE